VRYLGELTNEECRRVHCSSRNELPHREEEVCEHSHGTMSQRQRTRRSVSQRIEPVAFNAGLVSLFLATVPATVALLVEQARRKRYNLAGRRRAVYVDYKNSEKTSEKPCVVFESGANSWSSVWSGVVSGLSKHTRTFTYDRPGLGRSALTVPHGVSVSSAGARLVKYMGDSDVKAPYVLVAHSLGALFVNEALERLPREEILGIVYVDGASLESVKLLKKVVPRGIPSNTWAKILSNLGILRAIAPLALGRYVSSFALMPELLKEAKELWSTGEWLQAYTGEWVEAMKAADSNESKDGQWLDDIPITVIVPDCYDNIPGKEYVGAMQRYLASYSRDARLIHVKNCGHFVQIERPDVVINAVKEVIDRAYRRKKKETKLDWNHHHCWSKK